MMTTEDTPKARPGGNSSVERKKKYISNTGIQLCLVAIGTSRRGVPSVFSDNSCLLFRWLNMKT